MADDVQSGGRPAGTSHGDRLTSLDAAFLEMESPTRHMHVGGLFMFDPPSTGRFDFSAFLELVRSRLHLVPRYRQKIVTPPLGLGNPVWVDDQEFDLSYHVRHAALPGPGATAQLTEYCNRILSRQLDRDRPLWELYLIEGLEHGRLAWLGKAHHAMIDGLAGLDIATVMLDLTPDGTVPAADPEPWSPQPMPSSAELAVDSLRELVASPAHAVESIRRVVSAPSKTVRRALDVGRGVVHVTRSNLARPAPRSLLNRPPGRHRRFAIQRIPLQDAKTVKAAFGTTVNSVVLAAVADTTGRFLRSRGARTDGLWLRAMVPVSTRAKARGHHLGNRVVSVFVELPMFEMDPAERLHVCHDAMRELKSSHAAVAAGFLIGLGDFAPPTLHAMAARVAVNSRVFNFLVSNVPGPQVPVYCMGARLLGAFPFTPLAANHAYGVGVTSIDGWLNFGFTADYDALPEIELATGFLVDAFAELVACGVAETERGNRSGRRGRRRSVDPPREVIDG